MTPDEPEIFRALRGIRRIVINDCHGGFGLSARACRRYLELTGVSWRYLSDQHPPLLDYSPVEINGQHWSDRDIPRDDPVLVQVIEEMGVDQASGRFSRLKIVEIPHNVDWVIEEYDGSEWIAERHRTWR